ncbi:MAG: sterol desaturase family protein [Chitinophagales bacterium]|nr:sterol desaturase family protein [Bacteroidota bacterium]
MRTSENLKERQLFKNPLLELLSKTNIYITLGLHFMLISSLLWISNHAVWFVPTTTVVLCFVAGVFTWTFFEYILHRYAFHFVAESPAAKRVTYVMHGIHHDYPRDAERLFMPPVPAILILSVFGLFFYPFLGKATLVFLAGFELGYLIYSLVHYSMHKVKPPKGFKYLWKHHALHHYKYADKAYGVSTPFWDWVFGTLPPPK